MDGYILKFDIKSFFYYDMRGVGMTVKELIKLLSTFDPDLPVVGYCHRSEDDFFVQSACVDHADGTELGDFYNQGASCVEGLPPQDVVVLY